MGAKGREHDNVSFALTVAHLVAGTKTVPWHDCNGLQLAQSVLDNRRTIAVKLLKESKLLHPDVTTLLGYIEVRPNPKRNKEVVPDQAQTRKQKLVRPQAATTQATSDPHSRT
jgi:hypothetical protein